MTVSEFISIAKSARMVMYMTGKLLGFLLNKITRVAIKTKFNVSVWCTPSVAIKTSVDSMAPKKEPSVEKNNICPVVFCRLSLAKKLVIRGTVWPSK